jgi:nucleotide-binding universal stress UspA family protein
MFTKVLVPLDRSALAEQALGRAAAIARAARATLDVVLVHDARPIDGFVDDPAANLAEIEREYVDAIGRDMAAGEPLVVTSAVLEGEPVDMLCRRIWETNVDLVVMTSHGRTGFSRCWLGSVADGLVRHAGVPVVLLRPTEATRPPADASSFPRRILVPLDGSTEATHVLPAVASLARCSGARISFLRVVRPPPLSLTAAGVPVSMPPVATDDGDMRARVARATEWLSETANAFDAAYAARADAHVVVDAAVAQAIMAFARANDADLIAMTTRAHGISRLCYGSVADKVLRGSELPMLLVDPATVHAANSFATSATAFGAGVGE